MSGDPLADPPEGSAATLVLLRDGELGVEVLLGERPTRGSFPGAWVFPGGRVESEDAADGDIFSIEAARSAAVRETEEEVGLLVDIDELVALSVWHPPAGIERRYRTVFFAARMPDGDLTPSDELARLEWVRPCDALEQHAAGRRRLMPPTWVTLRELVDAHSVNSALSRMRSAAVAEFPSRFGSDERVLMWPPDADYETSHDDSSARSRHRHRLVMHSLPWEYVRDR